MRFLRSPIEIQGDGKVERIVIGKNELGETTTAAINAVDTGEREDDRVRAGPPLDRLQGHPDPGHPLR